LKKGVAESPTTKELNKKKIAANKVYAGIGEIKDNKGNKIVEYTGSEILENVVENVEGSDATFNIYVDLNSG
jgi:hypothetical protein